MAMHCTQCGTPVLDGASFCLTCGIQVKGGSTPAPPSETGAARPSEGDVSRRERSASVQEEIPSPLPREEDPTEIAQEISEGEYLALVERLQALREQVKWLARPLDFDPRRFFAVFDRVKPKPGYVPDSIFLPSSLNQPGGEISWPMEGKFIFYTRLVIIPRRNPRVTKLPPRIHGRPELKHLVFDPSASGFLQFAVLWQEAELWRTTTVSWWTYASDWWWVCSRQRLEALVPALRDASDLSPTDRMFGRRLTEEQRHWLSTVDPALRVRMRGEKAKVGGLAYSLWDGFAWLDCELTWPNRCRISRLEKLEIYGAYRVGMRLY